MFGIVILMICSFVFTIVLYPIINTFYIKKGFADKNYRQQVIPLGTGIVFLFSWLLAFIVGIVFKMDISWGFVDWSIFLAALIIMTFFGFIDDFHGNNKAKGLSGHFRRLMQGEVTTGMLKAVAGALIALLIAFYYGQSTGEIIVNFVVAVLSINFINLLDLRPGRAAKAFLGYVFILLLFGWKHPELIFVLVLAGSVLAHIGQDLQAKVMMGDTGSNALGVALGVSAVMILPLIIKIVLMVFLIFIQILTEKYSLTEIINKNKFLRYIDELGRN